MATIITKNSSTAGAVPIAGDLVQGEIAVNVTDKKLYTKNASGSIVQITPTVNDNGFKNRIINGAMMIDQRYSGGAISAATLASGGYLVDRFQFLGSQSAKFSAQQNQGGVTPPAGFTKYLGLTVASAVSIGSTDYFILDQRIEGFNVADLAWGTANAAPITLSFRVYSSLTGTFGGVIKNNAGNRSYPFSYSIPVSNTWTTISITVAGDTSGTWLTDNSMGLFVAWSLGVGSTYSGTAGTWAGTDYNSATGAVSVVGTSGATFYITGIQLEKGSTATSFDYRPYGTELALCQRYCEVIKPSGATTYAQLGIGQAYGTVAAQIGYFYQVAKRAQPTVTYDTASKYALTNATDGAVACTAIATGRSDVTSLAMTVTVASGLTAGHASRLLDNNTSNPITIISAEL